MNLRQSYEQLIADKLRRVPAPDADTSWQQMKRLLDEEDDKGGSGKRTPGNNGGWWRIGIIAIILSASGWLYFKPSASHEDAIAKTKNNTTLSNNHPAKPIDNKTTLNTNSTNKDAKTSTPVVDNDDKNSTVAQEPVAAATNGNTTNDDTPIQPGSTSDGVSNETVAALVKPAANNIDKTKNHHTAADAMGDNTEKNIAVSGKETGSNAGTTVQPGKKNKFIAANSANFVASPPVYHSNNTVNGFAKINQPFTGKQHPAGNSLDQDIYMKGSGKTSVPKILSAPPAQHNRAETNWLESLTGMKTVDKNIPASNTSLAVGDSIESNRNTAGLLSNETKKLVAKAQREKELEDMSRKEKKSLHLNLSNLFKPFSMKMDADPRWAAGLALNSGITLGAQNRFNYNMNAKSSVLSDYIPSAYLQFHLNDYVFAQTELHFVNPQFTPQLLVYRQTNDVTVQAGVSEQKSIFLQKLYYFSVPVTLHYSPINNLYFSAGVQFSSFQSGLATIQQKQYATLSGPDHPTDISNTILKFKDDSIAAKINPNEWRWQAGAEYYFNRFTVGLRYNRSFKNLFSADAAATISGGAGLKNESMLFFLRYNLFESRKKQVNDK